MLAGGEHGLSDLREAADTLAGSEARLEYARSLVKPGAALRRANWRAAVRELLRSGWIWRIAAAPPGWLSGPRTNCTPQVPGPAGRCSPGWRR
jgi:hypothetical protein